MTDNIKLVQNLGNICEICFKDKFFKNEFKDGSYISNKPLEVFLASAQIPCRFNSNGNGCQETLQGNVRRPHEKICYYRMVPCPYEGFGNCQEEIIFANIFEHLLVHSNNFVDFENMALKIELLKEPNEAISSLSLLTIHNHLFLLKYVISYKNNNCKFEYDLYYIPNDSKISLERHNIKFSANNLSLQLEMKTVPIDEYYKTAELSHQIDMDNVKKFVKESDVINVQFSTDSIPKNIADVLECPICNELMKSKIYLCNSGHSICNNCKLKLNNCPTCKEPYDANMRMRNYLAEEILSLYRITLNCQFPNCHFQGSFDQVDTHEENCVHKMHVCPICNEECGGYDKIKNHFNEKHELSYTDGDEVTFQKLITSGTHYMFAYDTLFQLTVTITIKTTNDPGTCYFKINDINKSKRTFIPIVTVSNGDLITTFKMENTHQPLNELSFSGIDQVYNYNRDKVQYKVKIEKIVL